MAEANPKAAATPKAAKATPKDAPTPKAAKAPNATVAKAAAPKAAAPKAAAPKDQAAARSGDAHERKERHTIVGKVVNDTANVGRAKKTVVIEVVRRVRDAVYGKYVKRAKRFHAHDEKEEFRTNDVVEIRASRPLSATKRWVTVRLVSRAEEA